MVLGHFGPFASQVGAMNYAESERRADLVEQLYAASPGEDVIVLN